MVLVGQLLYRPGVSLGSVRLSAGLNLSKILLGQQLPLWRLLLPFRSGLLFTRWVKSIGSINSIQIYVLEVLNQRISLILQHFISIIQIVILLLRILWHSLFPPVLLSLIQVLCIGKHQFLLLDISDDFF
jgi:hypothetical protein